jgi:anti-anti-sigma regulatory factor
MMMRGLVERVDVASGPAGTTVTLVTPVHRDVPVGTYGDDPGGTPVRGVDDDLTAERAGDGVLALGGAIDGTSVDRFRVRVLEAGRGGARDLTVDLDGVSVFSSSAVQAVHELHRDLPGLRLRARPGSVARRVLDLTGLADLLEGTQDGATTA